MKHLSLIIGLFLIFGCSNKKENNSFRNSTLLYHTLKYQVRQLDIENERLSSSITKTDSSYDILNELRVEISETFNYLDSVSKELVNFSGGRDGLGQIKNLDDDSSVIGFFREHDAQNLFEKKLNKIPSLIREFGFDQDDIIDRKIMPSPELKDTGFDDWKEFSFYETNTIGGLSVIESFKFSILTIELSFINQLLEKE